MNVLVLGGTQFVGRHIVETLLSAGHDVCLLNRGKTQSDLFPAVERIVGDRNEPISTLRGREFDAIVDCSGYRPGQIQRVADGLNSRPYYLFISTISIYSDHSVEVITEDSPVFATHDISDPDGCQINGETYGALKVMCESVVRAEFPRHGIVRPGIVIGPYDHTQRVSYWPWRARKGGDMAVPSRLDQPFQGIDGRDLAGLVLKFVEGGIEDTVNAVGPSPVTTLGGLIHLSMRVAGSQVRLVPLTADQAASAEPAWPVVLSSDGSEDGIFRVSHDRAVGHGLIHRPLEDSLRDILSEVGSLDLLKSGWSLEKESQYLDSEHLR